MSRASLIRRLVRQFPHVFYLPEPALCFYLPPPGRSMVTRASLETLIGNTKSTRPKEQSEIFPFQRQLRELLSDDQLSSKADIVSFLDNAKKLIIVHEALLSKNDLMRLLNKTADLGDLLQSDQIQAWCTPFWRTMATCIATLAKSFSISEIANILSVYKMAVGSRETKSDLETDKMFSNETFLRMYSKLLSVLDLRLRQVEDKDESIFYPTEAEFKSILSIIDSSAGLEGCTITPPLLERMVKRATSNKSFWDLSLVVRYLDSLSRIGYRDKYSRVGSLALDVLQQSKREDQETLCYIINRLPSIKSRNLPHKKISSILKKSKLDPTSLSLQCAVDLVEGLGRMGVVMDTEAIIRIYESLCGRSSECSPRQLALSCFYLNSIWPQGDKYQFCINLQTELALRATSFKANDLARLGLGFSRLRFRPSEECLHRILGHATDILLRDEILIEQKSDDYTALHESREIKGLKAEAELGDIEEPDHFRNKKTVRDLKKTLAERILQEDPKYQRREFQNFAGEELAAFLFGLAQINAKQETKKFFEFATEEIMRESIPMTAVELSFALWAVAINSQLDRRFFEFVLQKIENTLDKDKRLIKVRVGRGLVTLRALGEREDIIELVSGSYLNDCYQSWLKEELREESVPIAVTDVFARLKKLGLKCQPRSPLMAGLFVGDIVTGCKGQSFAIELRPDPLKNGTRHILGEDQWRIDMLEALGKTVLFVDEKVYLDLNEDLKTDYVKALIGKTQ